MVTIKELIGSPAGIAIEIDGQVKRFVDFEEYLTIWRQKDTLEKNNTDKKVDKLEADNTLLRKKLEVIYAAYNDETGPIESWRIGVCRAIDTSIEMKEGE
jgi:hypothetical protein